MQYADWSTLDLAATVDYAAARGKVWLVGQVLWPQIFAWLGRYGLK